MALVTTRNSQAEMDLLLAQIDEHEHGISDLIMALAFELGSMFAATGNLDGLERYVEDVTAAAMDEDGAR
jgi:hypothetical protein